jgi:GTPase SAR1 family protein
LFHEQVEAQTRSLQHDLSEASKIVQLVGGTILMFSKISVIGQGRAGKSTLINSILGHEFKELNSTVGVNANMYEVNQRYIQGGQSSGSEWKEYNPQDMGVLDEARAVMIAKVMKHGALDKKDVSSILDSEHVLAIDSGEVDGSRNISGASVTAFPDLSHGLTSEQSALKDTSCKIIETQSLIPVTASDRPTKEVDAALVQRFLDTGLDHSESLRLLLEDFGGQDNFYELYSILFSEFAMYIIVFNMEWLLPQSSEREQAIEYLRHWLYTAGVYCKYTKIFLVGTHKDIVSNARDHESISKVLYENFNSIPYWAAVEPFTDGTVSTGKGVLNFFPVDNKLGNKDLVIAHMMQKVEQSVRESDHLKHKVPFSWMALIDIIEKLKQRNTLQLSIQEFTSLCSSVGIPTSPNCDLHTETDMTLTFLNKLGMIMYHPAVKSIVVLRPSEFLFPYFTKIICDFEVHKGLVPEHDRAKRELRDDFHRLQTKGELSHKLLSLLWKNADHFNELKQLMVSLGLMVPIMDAEQDGEEHMQEDEEFLVPAILPEERVLEAPKTTLISAVIIFSEKRVVRRWQKKSFLSSEEVLKDGFVPAGIFSRLVGSIASQCQQTEPSTKIAEMTFKKNSASFKVRSKSTFTVLKRKHFVTLHITKGSGFGISEMIQGLLRSEIDHFGAGFDFLFLLPSDGESKDLETSKFFTLLSGKSGIKCKDEKKQGISISPSEELEHFELCERFGSWITQKGLQDWYHFFFSYRWNTFDEKFTRGLYHEMGFEVLDDTESPRCFLDKMRLETGGNFIEDFSSALITSNVAVAFVSICALDRMSTDRFNPTKDDNLLLEWTLILELRDLKKLRAVVPILIGDLDDSCTKMSSLFNSMTYNSLAETSHKSVNDKAHRILTQHNLVPSKRLHTRTVKDVVAELTQNLGLNAHEYYQHSKSFSRSGDQHKSADCMKNLIREVAHELILTLKKKGSDAVEVEQLRAQSEEVQAIAVEQKKSLEAVEIEQLRAQSQQQSGCCRVS